MLDWSQTHSKPVRAADAGFADATGLMVGTPIATAFGWRPVEALCVGDLVLTFDHSFRPITGVRRVTLWDGEGDCPAALRPVEVQPGVLPDAGAVTVLPEQGVMVESDAAENYRGDPFAVIAPRAIAQYGLAQPVRVSGPLEVIILEFEEDEVIYGQTGLLYHIPKAFDLLSDADPSEVYKVLSADETVDVLSELFEAYLDA